MAQDEHKQFIVRVMTRADIATMVNSFLKQNLDPQCRCLSTGLVSYDDDRLTDGFCGEFVDLIDEMITEGGIAFEESERYQEFVHKFCDRHGLLLRAPAITPSTVHKGEFLRCVSSELLNDGHPIYPAAIYVAAADSSPNCYTGEEVVELISIDQDDCGEKSKVHYPVRCFEVLELHQEGGKIYLIPKSYETKSEQAPSVAEPRKIAGAQLKIYRGQFLRCVDCEGYPLYICDVYVAADDSYQHEGQESVELVINGDDEPCCCYPTRCFEVLQFERHEGDEITFKSMK